jgi:RimJ/RimL family protein N-acetyltransferase
VTDPGALKTARLRLDPIVPHLAEELWAATEASLPELRAWMWWADQTTPDSTREFAEEAERLREEGMSYQFVIRDDAGVAGAGGVEIHGAERRIGEVGYWIRTDRTGRGYATEAVRAVVDFAFAELGLYRLELRAGVENRASQRVAEKAGFRREGRLRQGCAHGQAGYDCYLFGLLATDPRP